MVSKLSSIVALDALCTLIYYLKNNNNNKRINKSSYFGFMTLYICFVCIFTKYQMSVLILKMILTLKLFDMPLSLCISFS